VPTTFNIEQAQELVPWLQQTFDVMQPLIGKLDDLTHEVNLKFREMRSDGGDEAEAESTEARKARQAVEGAISQLVDSIVEKGILIKDPRRGLFDFPYERHGDLVYLCWLSGELDISYWHTMDSGFAGRQLLRD
jgi:hypothetical protein